jgi:peptidylprolyl isomerase
MAGSKEYMKRFGSLFMAGLFLVTTVGFTALIFWQTKNEKSDEADLQSVIDQSTSEESNPLEVTQEGENMLKGTPLSNFTPITTPAGSLQIIDLTEGTGDAVAAGATITAHYTGAYAVNGEIFESSKDSGQPATFPLGNVILGWQEGVPGMKVGGVRRLVIPGAQAYGEAPEGYTPGSTDRPMGTLIFDIELVSIGE